MTKESKENKSIKSLWLTLKDIFALSKPYRRRFYVATVATLVASGIWLTVPLGLRELLDAIFEA
ncbi:MAG TPA: ABC transporter ATP-binding protein, partial [Balneolaceae bacterium]|nr:ABC transporter ATP-binding protein [Balneolaceae bacterium]